jgi:hypothetical protein
LEQHGCDVTMDTIEVPALLRAARDAIEQARENGQG